MDLSKQTLSAKDNYIPFLLFIEKVSSNFKSHIMPHPHLSWFAPNGLFQCESRHYQ